MFRFVGATTISAHSRASGNPARPFNLAIQRWVPAFAGTSGRSRRNEIRSHVLAMAFVIAAPLAAHAASAEHGKQMYMQKGCWQCHGTQGQGAVTGPRLAPKPLAFETFGAFIRSSSRAMPPYREAVLSEADLADIYAYLESIPAARETKDLPLLQQWADKPK